MTILQTVVPGVGEVPLDWNVDILRDTEGWRATTKKAIFFATGINGAMQGTTAAIVKDERYTNLERGGQLADPRMARIFAIGLEVVPLTQDLATVLESPQDIATQNRSLLNRVQLITHGCNFRFKAGKKEAFFDVMASNIPSGYGVFGVAQTIGISVATTNIRDYLAFHNTGPRFELGERFITIPPGQDFRAILEATPAAGFAAVAAGWVADTCTPIRCLLFADFGTEVQ